ncbi:MAG: prolipoprotein diacylglyceryl transferase [Mailhella sp.]|nr:prolipoprotein diacylglyceryl transferase [Mailhella sp.]
MLQYPDIDPVALTLGPLSVHWYGVMYVLAFLAGWLLGRIRAARPGSVLSPGDMDDLATWIMIGVILGARIGYVLFYGRSAFFADPAEIFRIWNGGMSFHGGLAGVITAVFLWCRKRGKKFLPSMDFLAPLAPPGLFFGRIGNFINAELWGKATDAPWGMVFPGAGPLPRHPSQLYEACLEGLLLFAVLWAYSRKKRREGSVCGMFLMLYACFRGFAEFFRMPDAHIGYLAGGMLTMGHVLCMPMLLLGLWLVFRPERQK